MSECHGKPDCVVSLILEAEPIKINKTHKLSLGRKVLKIHVTNFRKKAFLAEKSTDNALTPWGFERIIGKWLISKAIVMYG